MWLANALTLSRIPLGFLFWFTSGWTSAALVLLAALTDVLDGNLARYLARRKGVPLSPVGGWLDPLADKLFVVIVLIESIGMGRVHPLDVALCGAREILLIPLLLVYVARGEKLDGLSAAPIGKVTTVCQLLAIAGIAGGVPHIRLLAIATGALGVATVAHYLRVRFADLRRRRLGILRGFADRGGVVEVEAPGAAPRRAAE